MPLPIRRYYTNTAVQQTLASSVNSSAATFTTSSTYSTWPTTFPFFAVIDDTLPTMEIVKVTAISGINATVVRGLNGTSAVSHPTGAVFAPAVIAMDLDEANAHTSSTAGVHGISGHVVGDTDTQTLSNKTLDSTTVLNAPSVTGTANLAGAHVTGNVQIDGSLTTNGTSTLTTLHVAGTTTLDGSVSTTGAVTASGNVTVNGFITDKRGLQVDGGSALIYTNNSFTASVVPADGSWKTVNNAGGVLFDGSWFAKGDLINNRTSDASIGVTTPGLYRWHALVDLPDMGGNFLCGISPVVNGALNTDHGSYFANGIRLEGNGDLVLGAGDKVQIAVYQTSGAARNLVIVRFGLILSIAS